MPSTLLVYQDPSTFRLAVHIILSTLGISQTLLVFFWSVFDDDSPFGKDLLANNPSQGGSGYNPSDYKDPSDPTKFIFKDSFTLFNSGGKVAGSAGSSGESHAEGFVSVTNIFPNAFICKCYQYFSQCVQIKYIRCFHLTCSNSRSPPHPRRRSCLRLQPQAPQADQELQA